jgi:hypothetical protein
MMPTSLISYQDGKPVRRRCMIPFFVADRPASLQIIRGLRIPPDKRIGLMTHANTTEYFKRILAQFPCSERNYCEVKRRVCPNNKDISLCEAGLNFREKVITMADSGVFTKEGCMFSSYQDLYNEYEKMNVDYGIMIDYLKDKERTLRSAEEALNTYEKYDWNFRIVGVAQGLSCEDYIDCYLQLRDMGFRFIAIGGLLRKRENSARYVQVRDEGLLWSVLSEIREIDPHGWVFALGCYAPSRHHRLLELGVFGSDYKGWIFQYCKRHPNAKRGNKNARKSRYLQVRRFICENIFSKSQVASHEDTSIVPYPYFDQVQGNNEDKIRMRISSFDQGQVSMTTF